MPDFSFHERIEDDLAAIEHFIALDDPEAAQRVLAAIDHTFDFIRERPFWFGSVYPSPFPDLRCLRRAPVAGFKQYQVFYLATEHETRVLYVRRAGGEPWETIFERDARD